MSTTNSTLFQPFTALGGEFPNGSDSFTARLGGVQTLIFDWDGVFNDGRKADSGSSGFTEADSMGVNMLRFGFWLRDNGRLPFTAIISGADNESARQFARREHFHAVLTGIKKKDEALEQLQQRFGAIPESTAFFFDDIIDLSAARRCGLRLFFAHPAAPMTRQYVNEHHLADYITGSQGGNLALRETCELMLSTMGLFRETVDLRIQFSGKYHEYLSERNRTETA
jgi:3-deoxy-D-manno-octulosonate 8-phosphate phosphatase (KDO 8-P phosphatase)